VLSLLRRHFAIRPTFTRPKDFDRHRDFTIRLIFAGRKDFTIRQIFTGRKDFTIRLIFTGRKDFTIRLIFTGRKHLVYIFSAYIFDYFSAFIVKYAPIFDWRNYFRPLGLELFIVVMIIYCVYDYY
jgi:hypothetical protein